MQVMTDIVNPDTHYLDMYSAFCNTVTRAKNYWDYMIAKRLQDKIESRLYELHDADRITGIIAMQYVVEMEQASSQLYRSLNQVNQN